MCSLLMANMQPQVSPYRHGTAHYSNHSKTGISMSDRDSSPLSYEFSPVHVLQHAVFCSCKNAAYSIYIVFRV
jgi:hypothetical protein